MHRSRFGPRRPQLRQTAAERATFVLAGTLAVAVATATVWAVLTGAAPWWILLLR